MHDSIQNVRLGHLQQQTKSVTYKKQSAQNNFQTHPKGADQQLQRQRQLSYLMQTNTHASSIKF